MAIDMKKILHDTVQAFRNGAHHVEIGNKRFEISFIHANQYPQYGVMTPLGEVVRLVVYGPDEIVAYPA